MVNSPELTSSSTSYPSKYDIIPIHNSDRATFRNCRRAWGWSSPSKMNLVRKASVLGISMPLWIGTGVHHCLEKFYHPGLQEDPTVTWASWFNLQVKGGIVNQSELKQFVDHDPIQLENGLFRVRGLEDILPSYDSEEFSETYDLVRGMMAFYRDWAPENDDAEVIAVEKEFSVPVLDPQGEPLYMVDNRQMPEGWEPNFELGNEFGPLMIEFRTGVDEDGVAYHDVKKQVHARGRIDQIVRKRDSGRYGIRDFKAQPLDEPILTPQGFIPMGDLKVGDYVIGSNGKSTRVTGIHPQGKKQAYRVVFHDGSSTRCCREHLWTIYTRDQKAYYEPKTRSLDWILNSYTRRWSITDHEAVEFDRDDELLIDPYLLGALLGDGYLGGNTVVLSCTEDEIIEQISESLPIDLEIYKYASENHSWGIAPKIQVEEFDGVTITTTRQRQKNLVLSALKTYGLHRCLSAGKFVPEPYLYASIEDRLALLQGLMDTDGNVYKGRVSFVTTSDDLKDAVIHLARSLGMRAQTWVIVGTNMAQWKIHIRCKNTKFIPFRLARKANAFIEGLTPNRRFNRYIERIDLLDEMEMQCISVEAEDGLYLTKDFIVTHNTTARLDEDYFRHLELDDQVSSYLALGELDAILTDAPYKQLEFATYEAILKAYPKPPTELKSGLPSMSRQTEATTAAIFDKWVSERGLSEYIEADPKYQSYYAWLLEIGDDRFVKRTDAWRNKIQRQNSRERLYYEALDMLSPSTRLYPNPRKEYLCLNCIFRSPCIASETGADWQSMLEDGYVSNYDR